MSHRCHAIGCDVEVPPALLMCKPHWMMLPKALRQEVWRLYRSGQELRKDPTLEYLAAAGRAIEAVAAIEKSRGAARQGRQGELGLGPPARAARDVPIGESWAFADHRTLAETDRAGRGDR